MMQPVNTTKAHRSVWLLAGFAALTLMLLALGLRSIASTDFWWQISTGRHILEHGWPRTDAFSYTVTNNPWIELRWVFCVLIYTIWSALGAAPLIMLATLTVAGSFTLIAWSQRRAAWTLPGLLVLALAVLAGSQRFVVRPELFTYAFSSVFLVILHAAARGRCRRLIWALPVLQVVWVNAHTMFVFGPVIALASLGGDTVRRIWTRLTADSRGAVVSKADRYARKAAGPTVQRPPVMDAPLAIITALVIAACFVNPWGEDGATFPFILLGQISPGHILTRSIEEFTSPFFGGVWTPMYTAASVLAVIGAATFILNWKRTDLARLALWAAMVYLTVTTSRNLGLFAFIAVWATLANLGDLLENGDRRTRAIVLPGRWHGPASGLLAAAMLLATWGIVSERWLTPAREPRTLVLDVASELTVAGPVDFLKASGARPELFHSMRDAPWIIWDARDRFRVFVDGRLEVYTAAFIAEYLRFYNQDWGEFSSRHGINAVLTNRDELPLLSALLIRRPDWVLVHLDDRHMVFVRDVPEHHELIAAHRIDPQIPWTPRSVEPSESISGWRRAIGARPRAWHSMGMARQFLALNAPLNAATYLQRAIAVEPTRRDARLLLSPIHTWRGEEAAANAALDGVGFTPRELAGVDRTLADLLLASGRETEAIAPLRRAEPQFLSDAGLYADLGRAYAAAGNLRDSAAAWRRAVALRPGAREYRENLAIVERALLAPAR